MVAQELDLSFDIPDEAEEGKEGELYDQGGNLNEPRHGTFSILCVDDSTYNLFVIQELLKEVDPLMEVHTALNGQLALKKVLEKKKNNEIGNKHTYDFIFLDLQMPVLDRY